ncbi:restriction endonuclease subunit S [Polaribacter sp. Hel_I_88]|uniref:restriction endonuclease subunit S n=1 Tax=Polaribacter sp. Hel_I_88 TaxID=1250006 RepID=UPI0006918E5E|nr:restriction endonuclease subunit S [Polaribacter sp. Hel_I_88]
MEKYTYKDSGIEWLSEIPTHWKVKRLSNICDFVRGNSGFGKNDLLTEGKYVALQYGKTYNVQEVNEQFKFYVNDNFYKNSQIVNYGDVIFVSTSETIEDLGHSVFYNRNDIGLIGGEQIVLKPNRNILDSKYLFYSSKVFGKELKKFATGIKVFRFDTYDLKTIYNPLPPKQEQIAIATYLDEACKRLDRIIAIKEAQIDKLTKNQKTKIIHFLTKGAKIDSKLKNAGINWMDKMPVHWRRKRLKDIVNLKSGDTITSTSIGKTGDYPVYGGNGLRGFTNNFTHEGYFPLIGRQGALCGNINYANDKFFASEHAVVATPILKCDVYWIGELMRLMDLNQYSNAAAQPGLSVERLKQLYIPLPPIKEQIEISEVIRKLTEKNFNLKKNLKSQIKTLKAYRKSLIHECVTGKKQVATIASKKKEKASV